MKLPSFYKVDQSFKVNSINDIPARVRAEFAKFDFAGKIQPDQSVALGVGSRGTHDLKDLVITTVKCLQDLGLKPYITPAMGSHGGGVAEGQRQVLKDLGISPETTGVPVKASMEVVSLGKLDMGCEVFVAKDAMQADHIAVINRVKPHTVFRSHVESGICKIMAVGLGRAVGAANMHRYELGQTIVPTAKMIIDKAPVLFGIAVTENAMGGTEHLRMTGPEGFESTDAELLELAWGLFPRLPMDQLDVLIIDEMGKDVSGSGIDPNVVGYWKRVGGEPKPYYKAIAVLDLTKASHGNATGMGMAEFTTKRFMEKVDIKASYLNAMTSRVLMSVKQPIVLDDDRAVVETAMDMGPDPMAARAARIINTGRMETFWVTRAVWPQLENNPRVSVSDEPLELEFDRDNRLQPFGV
jgi:hypothetical protein